MSDDRHKACIAIIDDNTEVLKSLKFVLDLYGYEVMPYPSAADFLADQGRDWRCLIIDQHMPQMTGLDLVEHLRSEGQTVPILLVTGARSAAIDARAATLGIQKVLEKPLCNDKLETFLETCIASGKAGAVQLGRTKCVCR